MSVCNKGYPNPLDQWGFHYDIASHRSWEGLQLVWGRETPISQEKSPKKVIPKDILKKHFLKLSMDYQRMENIAISNEALINNI